MNWLAQEFHTEKPIIGMLHMLPMPGDPNYDKTGGMKKILGAARQELHALQAGGVDAVMFSNEFSLPYLTETEPITAIAMAKIIGALTDEISVPFGVNVLWDCYATVDLAAATGATFAREVFTGVYGSDFGLWNTSIGKLARHRVAHDASDVRLIFNVVPEAAAYLGDRDLPSLVRTTIFNCKPDAVAVSGATAGTATNPALLAQSKEAAGDVPVFANTGVRVETIQEQLSIADGAVVGTAFKDAGVFENSCDTGRVQEFMVEARRVRDQILSGAGKK